MSDDLLRRLGADPALSRDAIRAMLGPPDDDNGVLSSYRIGKRQRVGAIFDDWLVIRFHDDGTMRDFWKTSG